MTRTLTLCFFLTACMAVAIDAGCAAYGEMRLSMPELGTDPLSVWVALLDARMTGVCRR